MIKSNAAKNSAAHLGGFVQGLLFLMMTSTSAVVLPAQGEAATLADVIDRVKPSIVGVGTYQFTRRPPGRFVATGFVVGDGHHVITNAHVLPRIIDQENRETLAVFIAATRQADQIREARVVGRDELHDLVLLRIDGRRLNPLRLGDSARVREGELYAFTGFPIGIVLGLRPVTHRGIVSALTPIAIPQMSSKQLNPELIKRLRSPYEVFQLDATAYPGNSGSPLFNPNTGEVIGIVSMVFVKESKENVLEKPSGISYAIPINYAKDLIKKFGVPLH